jgi:Predicted dehydrogenases and related proteins
MRIAMIGAGFIAKLNGSALIALPNVELTAICNRTVEKAEKLASELNIKCPIYADYHEMLEKEKPDAVVINLAHHLHKDCFIACARAGVNILIEKALANTYQECLEMIEAAEKYNIKATVCHTQRYNAVYETAMEFLEEHDLGRLLSINDNIHYNYFWDGRSPWQLSIEQSGGGIVLNYGVHQLDRVHYFLNQKTTSFKARYLAEKQGYDTYSSYAMMGTVESSTPYVITCTGYSGPQVNETRLVFEKGILQCYLSDNGLNPFGLYYGDNETKTFQKIPVELSNDQMYVRQFKAAFDYLTGVSKEAPVPLEWGAEMVRLVELGFKDSAGEK